MDAIVSSLNAFEIKEAGPLLLTWAVVLCLISSLPGKEEHNVLLVCGSMKSAGLFWWLLDTSYDIIFDVLSVGRRLIMLVMYVKLLILQHSIIFLMYFTAIY